jgi:hypothetical protein
MRRGAVRDDDLVIITKGDLIRCLKVRVPTDEDHARRRASSDPAAALISIETLNTRSNPHGLISLRQLLDHAAEHGYGVPAFNVNNLEQMRAIMEAADETDSR